MKKILLIILLLGTLLQAKNSQDFVLGVVSGGNDISLAFKLKNYKGETDGTSLGIDRLLYEANILGGLNFFMGVGVKSSGLDTIALRAPIGISIRFSKRLDIFAEFLPALHITPDITFARGSDFGLRYFF